MAGKILIVDDVATNRIVLKVKLSAARYDTVQAWTGAEVLRQIAQEAPDLLLLDMNLPDIDGIALCRRIKTHPSTATLPVIVLSASPTPEDRLAALRAGADDFMAKPVDESILMARLRSLLRAREAEQDLRAGEATCRDWGVEDQARTSGQAFALMALDLDRFKEINDTFDHAAGDAVLTEVAQRLRTCLREHDLLARFGGEEFLISLPETSLAQAEPIASAICRVIEATPFSLPGDASSIAVTISVGVTTSDGTDPVAAALDAADQALMRSKREGRNRVTTASRSSAA